MNVLSEILRIVRISGAIHFCSGLYILELDA
jgi:hypothetical protein